MDISNRIRVYNVEPIGIGTPYIEALTSYMTRLSHLHCLEFGVFFAKLLTPYLQKNYLSNIAVRGGNGFYDSSNGVNGIGSLAVDFIKIIRTLNSRHDLAQLTLLFWSNTIPTRGLLRKNKAWCGVCYHEFSQKNEPVYDLLIWHVKEVNVCIKHNIKLLLKCPYCYKNQQILSRKNMPGYCQHCRQWLGIEKISTCDSVPEEEIEMRRAIFIGDMLERSSVIPTPEENKKFSSLLFGKIFKECFKSNLTEMSKYIGYPKTTIHGWIKGTNLPSLSSLVDVCLQLNLTLQHLIEESSIPLLIKQKVCNVDKYNREIRNNYNYEDIKCLLNEEIEKVESRSLKGMAEEIGCDRRLLYLKFPEECNALVNKNRLHSQRKKLERQEILEENIGAIINELETLNIYPSRRKVEDFLGGKYLFKERYLRDKWNSIINKELI